MKIILQNLKHYIISIFLFSIIGNNFLGAAEEDNKALKFLPMHIIMTKALVTLFQTKP